MLLASGILVLDTSVRRGYCHSRGIGWGNNKATRIDATAQHQFTPALAGDPLDDGSHVGGKRIGELSTDFDGRSTRCREAWASAPGGGFAQLLGGPHERSQ